MGEHILRIAASALSIIVCIAAVGIALDGAWVTATVMGTAATIGFAVAQSVL